MEYKDFHKMASEKQAGGGKPPGAFHYMFIKIVDNGLIFSLFILVLLFAYFGLKTQDLSKQQWCLDIAKICLGVFLGLFAGKRKS